MPTIDTLAAEALTYIASGDPQITSANLILWWNRHQAMIQGQARWWFMRGSQTLSVSQASGSGPYTPTGSPRWVLQATLGGAELYRVPHEQAPALYPGTGPPRAYSLVPSGATFLVYVWPAPDTTYSVVLSTSTPLPDLASGQENVFTDQFPRLVIAAMCWSAFDRLQEDQEVEKWKAIYTQEYSVLLQAAREFDRSGLYQEPLQQYTAPRTLLGGGGGRPIAPA